MESDSIIKPPRSERLKAGRVTLRPGENVGAHTTENKEEILVILEGTATVLEEGNTTTITRGETHYIKKEQEHDVRNDGEATLTYLYIVNQL